MIRLNQVLVLPMLLPTAMACAAGATSMDRGEATQLPANQAPVFDNAQIEAELGRRPQLPERPRIAVVFRTLPSEDHQESPEFRFNVEERGALISAASDVGDIVVFSMSERHIGSGSLDEIRLAAARQGADAVMIVEGDVTQEVSANGWSATYALLVPIFFAPGADLETTFRVDAQMIDVRNGYLYMTAEAEVEDEQQRAHVWIDGDESTDESKQLAMELLGEEIKTRFTSMFEPRPTAPPMAEPEEPEAPTSAESSPERSETAVEFEVPEAQEEPTDE